MAMRLGVIADSTLERLALFLGLVPVPLIETHIGATLARSITAGVELGIFDCLAAAPLTLPEIAARCATDPVATALLLEALADCGYLALEHERYALARQSRKWLLRDSPRSLRDKILLQAIEWRWLAELEGFVRTGRPLDFHATMSDGERDLYHRSMRALAGLVAPETARRTRVPRQARLMLDLGGSHGHFAAAICRRHPLLSADVLDLPEAIERAAPLLAAEGLGDRLRHVAGDATGGELGEQRYDLVFMSNLAHHLTEGQNRALAQRVARALRPGGAFVIQEPVRTAGPGKAGQTASLLGLYFALQSKAGVRCWTQSDLAGWQAAAGLRPCKPVRLRSAPGWLHQSAQKG
jgi:hypothetical protein